MADQSEQADTDDKPFDPAALDQKITLPKIRIASPDIDIFIHFKDTQGEITKRGVTVKRVWAVSLRNTIVVLSIEGFCHLRQDQRDFNIQRIMEAFEWEGGPEIWDLAGWLLMVIGQGKKRQFPRPKD